MRPELAKAARVLRGGGLVAFPTDTVWGVLVDPENREAAARVYRMKGRDATKPLQLLLADAEVAARLLPEGYRDPRFQALAEGYWPGPLTLVVPAGRAFPAIGAVSTLGLRVPDHPELRALLRAVGGFAAATSLNQSGAPPVRSEEEARRFPVDLVVQGPTPPGIASSVVDLLEGRVVRVGAIPEAELRRFLEER